MKVFISSVICFGIVTGTSCNGDGFIKTDTGLQYKHIEMGNGSLVQPGQFLKLEVIQQYEDTILLDTRNQMPQYQALDTLSLSPEAYYIFSRVHSGDSLVFKYLSDSAFKGQMPAFAEKGKWLYTFVKVEKILPDQDSVRSDYQQEEILRHPETKEGMPEQY